MLVLEILFIVAMVLWFLANLPVPQTAQFGWANAWLPFFAVLLLGLYLFVPVLR